MGPGSIKSGGIDEQYYQRRKNVYTTNCQGLADTITMLCLVNAVPRADEYKDHEDQKEDRESGIVKYAEERNMHNVCCMAARGSRVVELLHSPHSNRHADTYRKLL